MKENLSKLGMRDNSRINQDKIREFYDQQVLANPDMPAILGVSSKLAADLRDFEEWQSFRKLVKLHTGMKVLELGCGSGRWCEHFSGLVKSITGIDISKNTIDYAQMQAAKKSLRNIKYYNTSLEDFHPSGDYDLIYFSGVALYMEDSAFNKNLNKYIAHLNSDGIVVVRDSITNKAHTIRHPQGYSAIYRTKDEFDEFFNKLGFRLAAHERAFPLYCLSKVFSKGLMCRCYKASPSLIKKIVIKAISVYCSTDITAPNWKNGDLIYNHEFLVYVRTDIKNTAFPCLVI